MANKLLIYRSEATATPSTLAWGQLAYSDASDNLFIGLPNGTPTIIGGKALMLKLQGIATGANNYTHPTSVGNKHVPTGGATGQILKWSATGTAVWGDAETATLADSAIKLKTARTIAGVSFNGTANIALPLGNMVQSSTHKTVTQSQLDSLSALTVWYAQMTDADADGVIDTIAEVLTAFSGANEGLNVASELLSPTNMTLDGGTF